MRFFAFSGASSYILRHFGPLRKSLTASTTSSSFTPSPSPPSLSRSSASLPPGGVGSAGSSSVTATTAGAAAFLMASSITFFASIAISFRHNLSFPVPDGHEELYDRIHILLVEGNALVLNRLLHHLGKGRGGTVILALLFGCVLALASASFDEL